MAPGVRLVQMLTYLSSAASSRAASSAELQNGARSARQCSHTCDASPSVARTAMLFFVQSTHTRRAWGLRDAVAAWGEGLVRPAEVPPPCLQTTWLPRGAWAAGCACWRCPRSTCRCGTPVRHGIVPIESAHTLDVSAWRRQGRCVAVQRRAPSVMLRLMDRIRRAHVVAGALLGAGLGVADGRLAVQRIPADARRVGQVNHVASKATLRLIHDRAADGHTHGLLVEVAVVLGDTGRCERRRDVQQLDAVRAQARLLWDWTQRNLLGLERLGPNGKAKAAAVGPGHLDAILVASGHIVILQESRHRLCRDRIDDHPSVGRRVNLASQMSPSPVMRRAQNTNFRTRRLLFLRFPVLSAAFQTSFSRASI
eukprot:7322313-Prymnesium_polylepis.2